MYYVIFPQIQYSYKPHILSLELLNVCRFINAHSDLQKDNQITFLVRTDEGLKHYFKNWYYYKDVYYKDSVINSDRMLRLTKQVNKDFLNSIGFRKMTSTNATEIKPGHPQNLRWNIQYRIDYSNNRQVHVNQLVQNCSVESFFEMATHYTKEHNTEPLMFHDLKKINFHNFDETMRVFHGAVDHNIEHIFLPVNVNKPAKFPFKFDKVSEFDNNSHFGLHGLSVKDIPQSKKKDHYNILDYQTKLF